MVPALQLVTAVSLVVHCNPLTEVEDILTVSVSIVVIIKCLVKKNSNI